MNGDCLIIAGATPRAYRVPRTAHREKTPNAERRKLNASCPRPDGPGRRRGFTLIELIVVIAIIGILAAIALNPMKQAPRRAKEAALKENLFTLRTCLDQYFADFQKYPDSLEELVSKGYLRKIPMDPVTEKPEWTTVMSEEEQTETGEPTPPGIIDIHSGSSASGLDGTAYSEW